MSSEHTPAVGIHSATYGRDQPPAGSSSARNATSERLWLPLMVGLMLLAFALRVFQLGADSLWFDEATTARNLVLPLRQVVGEAQSLGHLPYYLLLRLVPGLERTEFGLRYPSVLFGVMGAAGLYAVGRLLLDRSLGGVAALFLALSPWHLWHCREARAYGLTVATSLWAVGAFLRLWRRQERADWVHLVAAQSATIYAHLFASLMSGWQTLLCVFLWITGRLPWRLRRWWLAQLAVCGVTAPVFGLALWSAAQKSQISWIARPDLSTAVDLTFHLSGVKFLRMHNWSWIVWLVWLAMVAWGIFRVEGVALSRGEARVLLLGWATIPAAILFLVSLAIKPVYVHRYLLFTLPPYLLLLGAVLAHPRRNLLVLLGGLFLLVSQGWATVDVLSHPAYDRPDWRSVQRYLAQSARQPDGILFHPWLLKRPFDYYNTGTTQILEDLMTTVGRPQGPEVISDELLAAELARVEEEAKSEGVHRRLWVVEHDSDLRASHWLTGRNGWVLEHQEWFAGGLQVHLYQPESVF